MWHKQWFLHMKNSKRNVIAAYFRTHLIYTEVILSLIYFSDMQHSRTQIEPSDIMKVLLSVSYFIFTSNPLKHYIHNVNLFSITIL